MNIFKTKNQKITEAVNNFNKSARKLNQELLDRNFIQIDNLWIHSTSGRFRGNCSNQDGLDIEKILLNYNSNENR